MFAHVLHQSGILTETDRTENNKTSLLEIEILKAIVLKVTLWGGANIQTLAILRRDGS